MSDDAAQAVRVHLQLAEEVQAADCPDQSSFAAWATAVFDEIGSRGRAPSSLVLRIVAADESAALNREFRGKDAPTNVLAFPAGPALIPELDQEENELGDLILCLEVAAREASEQAKTLSQHVAHLTVHGTLHLLGYDHQSDAEAERMEGLERLVLKGLGLPDPY